MAQHMYQLIDVPYGTGKQLLSWWDYKAPHALRGTPPRPKSKSRSTYGFASKLQRHGGRK